MSFRRRVGSIGEGMLRPVSLPGQFGRQRVHCWLPVQIHRLTSLPFVVAAFATSRQSPDLVLVTVPLELRVHCWLVPVPRAVLTLEPGVRVADAPHHELAVVGAVQASVADIEPGGGLCRLGVKDDGTQCRGRDRTQDGNLRSICHLKTAGRGRRGSGPATN